MKFRIVAEEETNQGLIDYLVEQVPQVFPPTLDLVLEDHARFAPPQLTPIHYPCYSDSDSRAPPTYTLGWEAPEPVWTPRTQITTETAARVSGTWISRWPGTNTSPNDFFYNLTPIVHAHQSPDTGLVIVTHRSHILLSPCKEYARFAEFRVGTYHNSAMMQDILHFAGYALSNVVVLGIQNEKKPIYWRTAAHEIGHVVMRPYFTTWLESEETWNHCRNPTRNGFCIMGACKGGMIEKHIPPGYQFCERCTDKLEYSIRQMNKA